MEHGEIERYLHATIAHSVVVSVHELRELPGWLRLVTIHRGLSVTIELLPARKYIEARDAAGFRYLANYEDLPTLTADLEEYLGRPVADWTNYTATPYRPTVVQEPDPDANDAYLHRVARERSFPLPRGVEYRQGDIYWRHIERYGEFRPDKLEEEEE